MTGLVRIEASSFALFSPTEIRARCRANSDQDDLIAALLSDAIDKVETDLNRQLLSGALWAQTFDSFHDGARRVGTYAEGWPGARPYIPPMLRTSAQPLVLLRNPVGTVSSVQYRDVNGDWQTVAEFEFAGTSEPCRVSPALNQAWPPTADLPDSVVVQFAPGYGEAANVPGPLKAAVAMLVAHWLEHPEAASAGGLEETPLGYEDCIGPFRYLGEF